MPLIGITCGYDTHGSRAYLGEGYYRALTMAGGTPLLLPPLGDHAAVRSALASLDGLVLSGGDDVDPLFFGEEPRPGTGEITPERDEMEIAAVRLAREMGLPLFGICRGMQVLNIALGGDIHQDIATACPDHLKHVQQAPRWYASHGVDVFPGTRLAGIVGATKLRVNSFHHQVLRRIAPGFRPSAMASDGIVEAVEAVDSWFALGVQWHPEAMWERDPVQCRLFSAFVSEARLVRGHRKERE